MREAGILVIVGQQGVGKTFRQVQEAKNYAFPSGRKGRKVLVFDCNIASGSYKDFKAIDFDIRKVCDIKTFKTPQERKQAEISACSEVIKWVTPEVRRVINYRKDGNSMSGLEMNETCLMLMEYFKDGMLILEDFNTYMYGSRQHRFLQNFIRVRHKNVDLVMILQSLGALDPRIWANTAYIRLHKTFDSVDRLRNRIGEKFELLKISELVVWKQYDIGNVRYFVYINFRDGKLMGCSANQFKVACSEYLSLYSGELKRFMIIKGLKDKTSALNEWVNIKAKQYLVVK